MSWKSKIVMVTVAVLAIVSSLAVVGVVLAQDSGDEKVTQGEGLQAEQALQAQQGLPIVAMGTVQFNCTIYQEYNVTSVTWNDNSRWYEVTLTGIEYHWHDYVTSVTAVGPGTNGNAVFGSDVGYHLIVQIFDATGAKIQSGFSFVVLGIPMPNQAPNKPINLVPVNGAQGVSVTPTLQSSSFSDPDAGDTHAMSNWQIRTTPGSYSNPVFDVLSSSNLTMISVPSGVLSNLTGYHWHVRHQDNNGNWSEWSTETSFMTIPANDTTAPKTPARISPAYGTSTNLTPTFDWSDVTDPSGVTYELQIDNNSDYSSPERYTVGLTSSTYTLTAGEALTPGNWYWRVRAVDGSGNASPWNGGYWRFSASTY